LFNDKNVAEVVASAVSLIAFATFSTPTTLSGLILRNR